tara:strand:- start:1438 stop:1851 length:414 start_codon:yes stop_codon:yes gene_type:complete
MGRDFQKVCKDPFCGANVVPEPVGLVSRCYPAPDPKPQLSEEFDGDLGYSDIEISKLKLPPRPFRPLPTLESGGREKQQDSPSELIKQLEEFDSEMFEGMKKLWNKGRHADASPIISPNDFNFQEEEVEEEDDKGKD